MTYVLEDHPYNTRESIPNDTKTLIVGTAPPPRFSNPSIGGERDLDVSFFYGSEDNYLWWNIFESISSEIHGVPLFNDSDTKQECIIKMRAFLSAHKIWMHDVLQKFERKDPRSAADSKIRPVEFSNFSRIFQQAACVGAIAFTSEQAAKWTIQALNEQELLRDLGSNSYSEWRATQDGSAHEKNKSSYFTAEIAGRKIKFYVLPSPTGRSRAGLTMSAKIEIYKRILF